MSRRTIRVLLIDDDEDDYLLVRGLLLESHHARFEVDWCPDYDEALAALSRRSHDAYLIDYRLGPYNGLDLVRAALAKGCSAPLLVLTGLDDDTVDIQALELGATDFLVKGQITTPLLERAIRYGMEHAAALAALRASNERLRLEMEERASLEEQLRQSQKLDAIGRLAGGIAHDFNNLLTTIIGYGELIAADAPSQPQGNSHSSDAQEVLKAARRAAQLTQQLLAFSRKQPLHPSVLSLNAVVHEVVREVEASLFPLRDEHSRIITRLAPDLWPVEVDPQQIGRVIGHLVVNACEAMPYGGLIEIRTENIYVGHEDGQGSLKHGWWVGLSVRDTGVGIDEDVRSHLFEPFFTTKEVGKGSGLGLSAVYGIVKQSGGEIQVASMPDKGATFTIYLPRSVGDDAAPRHAAAPHSSAGAETVLVVEDDSAVRALVSRVLRRKGYSVLVAADGLEALRLAETQWRPIDLLVTDVLMPEMDGHALADRLRARIPQLRVLFMSGYPGEVGDISLSRPHGFPLLNKPFSPDELCALVRSCLDAPES